MPRATAALEDDIASCKDRLRVAEERIVELERERERLAPWARRLQAAEDGIARLDERRDAEDRAEEIERGVASRLAARRRRSRTVAGLVGTAVFVLAAFSDIFDFLLAL